MRFHHNYSLVQEALADDATRECILSIQNKMRESPLFPVADDRFRHPGEETVREVLEGNPGADRALVRAYFMFRPATKPPQRTDG